MNSSWRAWRRESPSSSLIEFYRRRSSSAVAEESRWGKPSTNYVAELSDEAIADLSTLPLHLIEFVEKHLRWLERDPVGLSRPATFPYWQVQAYRFDTVYDDDSYFFMVLY